MKLNRLRYLLLRLLTLWKRTRLSADVLARRLLFRLLASPHILSLQESVLPKALSMSKDARVIVLAPHSDDESIGCGGLLATYPEQIQVVCLTNGAKGDPAMERAALISLREQELSAAMEVAGITSYQFLGIEDQHLVDSYAQFSALDIQQADMIFLPNFLDQHPDHKAVTWLLQRMLRTKGYRPTLKIAFYEIWGALPVWNAYTDLDGFVLEKKHQMIRCFRSQLRQIDYTARIDGLHTYRGISVGKPAVEAYLVLDVQDFLAIE
ncbi:MAG: PIG-L family deacetylase [Thiotrichales bacterium]|jgi:LmbE family N-acetylglucosaminyl deacetylase|nr:PIG-L family deacetylase [Thiotrichales bacterium]